MSGQDRTFIVVSPEKMIWAVRFKTEEAAWRRLVALKNMRPGASEDRNSLARSGWRVSDTVPAR